MAKNKDKKKRNPDKPERGPVLTKPSSKDKITSCEIEVQIEADGDCTLDILDSSGKAVARLKNDPSIGTINLSAIGITSHKILVQLCGTYAAGDIIRFVICEGTGPQVNCVAYKREVGPGGLDCGSCGSRDKSVASIVKNLRASGYDQIIVGVRAC